MISLIEKIRTQRVIDDLIHRSGPLFVSNGLNAIISLGILLFIARLITPQEYGYYASILGVVQFGLIALSGGIAAWATREISSSPLESKWIIPAITMWFAILLLVLPFLVSTLTILLHLRSELVVSASILAAYAVIHSYGDGVSSFLIANNKTMALGKANIVEAIISAVLIIGFLALGKGIVGIAAGELLASLVRTTLIVFSIRRLQPESGNLLWNGSRSDVRRMMHQSSPLWGVQIVYAAGGRLQPTAVGAQSALLSGYFSAGMRFVDIGAILISPLLPALLPMFTQSRNDPKEFRKTVFIASTVAIVLALPPVIVFAFFGSTVIRLTLGNQYSVLSSCIPYICILIVIRFLSQIISAALIAVNQEQWLVKTSVVSAIALIAGLYALAGKDDLPTLFVFICAVSAITLATWWWLIDKMMKTNILPNAATTLLPDGERTDGF